MAQSKSEIESNVMNTNRRKFMKGVTTGVIGISAIGASNNVSADIPWTTLSGVGLAYESSAVALDYLMGDGYVDEAQNRVANYIHYRYGDMRNYDGYTGETALHTEVLAGYKEMELASEQVMTGIRNQIEMSDNVGYSKGKVALIESLNGGDDITTAKSKMNDALDTYYSKIEKAILQHYKTQVNQMWHMNRRLSEHSNVIFGKNGQPTADESILTMMMDETDGTIHSQRYDSSASDQHEQIFTVLTNLASTTHSDFETGSDIHGFFTYELLDGTTVTDIPIFTNGNGNTKLFPSYDETRYTDLTSQLAGSQYGIGQYTTPSSNVAIIADVGETISHPTDGASSQDLSLTTEVFNVKKYQKTLPELVTARDRVNSNLQGFADDLYSQYQSGDLSLSEIVDPITYATEMATDLDNDAFRQVSAAQLGFATNATENVTIQINDGDSEPVIETDLYTSHSPSGGSWSVGTQYDPSTWSEPLFITYPDTDGENSMAQLETPFTIQSAIDKDGNSVDTFQNRETNIQTADITKIQEQLEDLRQTQLELQQDSGTSNTDTPQDSDGGSGGSSTNIVDELTKKYFGFPLYGWIAGGGVVTYVGTKVGNE